MTQSTISDTSFSESMVKLDKNLGQMFKNLESEASFLQVIGTALLNLGEALSNDSTYAEMFKGVLGYLRSSTPGESQSIEGQYLIEIFAELVPAITIGPVSSPTNQSKALSAALSIAETAENEGHEMIGFLKSGESSLSSELKALTSVNKDVSFNQSNNN